MSLTLFSGFRSITRRGTIRDAFAGVTLASMNIPQVLGYTRIAGTPAITGLYTVLLPLVGFAVFGSSRHLVVAADGATAAIFSSSLGRIAPPGSVKYLALVSTVALLTAVFLFFARIFKLGFIADFLSRTVLVGFLAGVGVQVGIVMLGDMFGLTTHAHNTLVSAWQLARMLPSANLPAAALATLVAAAILLGNRLIPSIPLPFVAVLGSIAASAALHFEAHGIAIIGPVPGGLPALGLPSVTWSEILALLPVAASCFVMIIAQSAATSRVFASRYRETVDENADILGVAVANAAAGISGTFVVNGSPTQTAMADRAGARSQVAQLVFAAAVLLVLLFFTGPLQYLPRCVLGAIVFTVAIGMIDLAALRDIRRESPGEFILAAITATTVVGIGVEQGILLAIVLSLFRHVRHSYRPHTMMLIEGGPNGLWEAIPIAPGKQTEPGFIVYRIGADLFYANAARFIEDVRALVDGATTPVRWFVVDASAITDLDFSAAHVIRDLLADLTARNITIAFARVAPYLRADMDRHGITAAVDASESTTGVSRVKNLAEKVAATGLRGFSHAAGCGTLADVSGFAPRHSPSLSAFSAITAVSSNPSVAIDSMM